MTQAVRQGKIVSNQSCGAQAAQEHLISLNAGETYRNEMVITLE